MAVRRKDRSRGIRHETDKYEKISGGSRFLRCRSGGKLIFIPGIREQVFSGTAYGEYSLCSPLGTGYGLGAAFAAALIRNLLGLGSLMAFPGSMFGALICGLVYKKTQNIPATLIGEVFGTSVLGGLTAYPVAIFLMGKSAAGLAFYAYVIPFLVSTAGGAVISGVLIYSLKKANILAGMQQAMGQ